MPYYINPSLASTQEPQGYHGGDMQPGDVPVPQRPDETCLWNGVSWSASLLPHQQLVAAAQAGLNKSDITCTRCYSAGVPVPSSWQSYRNALRCIANGTDTTSTTLPAIPQYPQGT
jgi:hypothetical protein